MSNSFSRDLMTPLRLLENLGWELIKYYQQLLKLFRRKYDFIRFHHELNFVHSAGLSPCGSRDKPLRALLVDSWFEVYKGVVCLIVVVDGKIEIGDKIVSAHNQLKYEVMEIGIVRPNQVPTGILFAGQLGYLITGMKSAKEAYIGDTFFLEGQKIEALPGFRPIKSMVFAGVFPIDAADFEKLREAIERLTLNDSSVTVHKESR